VIHPAAWTDVDGCARDPEQAIRINGFGAQNVALAAAQCGAAILYVSSNEVFSGRANRAYREYDRPHRSTLTATANGSASSHPARQPTPLRRAHGLAVRPRRQKFRPDHCGAAKAAKPLRVVVNEVANPTYNDDLPRRLPA